MGTRTDHTIPYNSMMTEFRLLTRDNYQESYVVGFQLKFADSNDNFIISVPGFYQLDAKNVNTDLNSGKNLIGFSLEFTKNINLDSTLVLKNVGRLYESPTDQDDTFS